MRLPVADRKVTAAAAKQLLRRNRKLLTRIIVLQTVAAVCALSTPYLLGKIIDQVGKGVGINYLNWMGLAILTLVVVSAVFRYFSVYASDLMGERVFAQLREGVVTRVMHLPLSIVESAGTGDLLGRTVTDVNNLSFTVRQGVPSILVIILMLLLTIIMGVITSPVLSISLVVGLVPMFFIARWYQPLATPAYRATAAAEASLSGVLTETLENAKTVEAFSMSRQRINRAEAVIGETSSLERYTANLRMWLLLIFGLSTVLPPIVALCMGVALLPLGWVSLGQVATITLYAWQIRSQVGRLHFWYDMFQMSYAALARITGVNTITDDRVISTEKPRDEAIAVHDVHYAYSPGQDVLHGVDLNIIPGERLAIVGPSGAGKTTLGRLLAGIHAPGSGSVRIGGVEVASLPETELHRQIALINQEHHVFVGTVADNLRFARPDATDAQMWQALELVEAADWVRALEEGLSTKVGSGGVELTDAQAQQIALARVTLLNPHTLILDEATSLLDPTSARSLERSLSRVLEGRTVIAIAHRLYTAHDADRIAVVIDGRVVELGSHQELVAAGGEYARLWRAWQHVK